MSQDAKKKGKEPVSMPPPSTLPPPTPDGLTLDTVSQPQTPGSEIGTPGGFISSRKPLLFRAVRPIYLLFSKLNMSINN